MEKIVWELFSWKISSVTWHNVFRINFTIISGWNVSPHSRVSKKDFPNLASSQGWEDVQLVVAHSLHATRDAAWGWLKRRSGEGRWRGRRKRRRRKRHRNRRSGSLSGSDSRDWRYHSWMPPPFESGRRALLEEASFRKVHFLEILENPQTVENKGESDHFLEILENLEILEILEIPPVKRPPFVMTPFSGPNSGCMKPLRLLAGFACHTSFLIPKDLTMSANPRAFVRKGFPHDSVAHIKV